MEYRFQVLVRVVANYWFINVLNLSMFLLFTISLLRLFHSGMFLGKKEYL